jgi:hypothetical protein
MVGKGHLLVNSGWVHTMAESNLSLREYLAGQALAGMMANAYWNPLHKKTDLDEHVQPIAAAAVAAADAVMKILSVPHRKLKPMGDE